jgi:raffinose/stachyose/melibiose transport system permease protein
LESIPEELYEAAVTEGANAAQQARYITLPLLKPVIGIALLLSMVFAVRSFDIVKTLTNAGPAGGTEVVYTYMFDYFFQPTRATQLGYGAAVGVAATSIAAIVAVAYRVVNRKRLRDNEWD